MNADSDSDSDLDDYFPTNLPESSELELDISVPNRSTSRGLRISSSTQTLQSRLSSTLRRRQSSTSSRRGRGYQAQQDHSDNDG